MESLYRYFLLALQMDEPTFVAQNPRMVLLKPPLVSDEETVDDDDDGPTQLNTVKNPDVAGLRDRGEFAREWHVVPARKTSEYPPYNRIMLGRSRVCDIVVPFSSVSKVH